MFRANFIRCMLLFLSIALVSDLEASETRLASMGKTGRFTYDNANLRLFPGGLYRYQNLLITEMRVKNDENSFSAGIHLPLGTRALGGLYLNRNLNLPVPASLGSTVRLNSATDFLLALKVGENNLGLRLTTAVESNDVVTDSSLTGTTEEATYFEFAGGVSSERYDFGAYFGIPNIESSFGDVVQNWKGLGFGVSGRFFLGAENSPMQYVPVVIINQFTADLEQGTTDATTDFLEFRMAVGVHYNLDDNNLVVLGVEMFGIRRNKIDTPNVGQRTESVTHLPAFYVGGETQAKRWLTLRLGASQELTETETSFLDANGDKVENARRDSNFNVSFGVGIAAGRFLLDFDINDNFLFEGPDFISGQGSDSVSDFVNRLSISYHF